MVKMTKVSKENLRIADRIVINKQKVFDCFIDDCYLLEAWKNGNVSFISGSDGPIIFKSISEAQKVIKDIRPCALKFPTKVLIK